MCCKKIDLDINVKCFDIKRLLKQDDIVTKVSQKKKNATSTTGPLEKKMEQYEEYSSSNILRRSVRF